MGRRGPAPQSKAMKLLHGTFRQDRAIGEIAPAPGICTCPRWLSREAKAEWRYIVPKLLELGLLTYIDKAALVSYCTAYADLQRTERDIAKHGATQLTENGYEQNRPVVAIRNQARAAVKQFLAEFGLSPSARTRINATPKKEDEAGKRATDFLLGK